MKVLIIAGAGTSIELGVPGMVGLAEEFVAHANQWDIEPDLVERILGDDPDIEHLIEELDRICSARGALEAIVEVPPEFERLDRIRAEVEWFIQHAAERVFSRDAHLMWGAVLRRADQVRMTVVTTNYDRAIELAANAEGIKVEDGFGTFDQREIATWSGFEPSVVEQIMLVKLHGSTDWYTDSQTGAPTKLRHPMPLFGRAALHLRNGSELGSALILPSREKLLTRDPYPRLSQAFLNAADQCDVAIVIGSSLRDHHLRGAAQAIAQRVPLFIVNPKGQAHGIGSAIPLAQSASAFLIGTFPQAISGGDLIAGLRQGARQNQARCKNCLFALRTALDAEEQTDVRCRSVEELDAEETGLDDQWLRELLSCSDAHVARYALGLIPQSPRRKELLQCARSVVHATSDGAYREDLDLLEEMLST